MRITGRVIRPSNLAERRLLLSMGVDHVRVPRSMNPYAVARRLSRLTAGGDEMQLLRRLINRPTPPHPWPLPVPPPDHVPVHA